MIMPRTMETMTLDELLRRKAIDYGYGSLAAMAESWGLSRRTLYQITQGVNGLSIEMRRRIVNERDVAPEVLERMV